MAGTLLGVNTTLKVTSTGTTYWSIAGTGDTSMLQIAANQYAIVTAIIYKTLGTNSQMGVKLQEVGGQQLQLIPAASTTLNSNYISYPLYLAQGDKLIGNGTGGGTGGQIWIIGTVFQNSP
jgi:hypothetical protein